MTAPDVSVIIPTWNRRDRVLEALASVARQTVAIHEVIVVDDGSSDGTAERIRQTCPAVNVLSQPNAGVSNARNHGIRVATGEWLAFLDSDDRWQADKLERQFAMPYAEHRCRLLHCDEFWYRDGKRVNPKLRHRKRGGWIYAHCVPLCVISPSAVVIHRSLFDDIGDFDESLPACEDYDLWLRICSQEPVHYVDAPLVMKIGGHADQLSRQHAGMDRFRLQALARQLRSARLTSAEHALTFETFRYKFSIYTKGAAKRGRDDEVRELQRRYADLLSYAELLVDHPALPTTSTD